MSDIALDDVELITFPDGQTHISLKNENLKTVHPVDIRCSIRSPDELFKLLMVGNILDANDIESRLHIKYLMGARMDRAIDQGQPFTLKLVCDMINNGFPNSPVTVFCPHSEAVSLLLKNYKEFLDSEKNFYYRQPTILAVFR
jgi:ribose-phosphate pyrophosphokinase